MRAFCFAERVLSFEWVASKLPASARLAAATSFLANANATLLAALGRKVVFCRQTWTTFLPILHSILSECSIEQKKLLTKRPDHFYTAPNTQTSPKKRGFFISGPQMP